MDDILLLGAANRTVNDDKIFNPEEFAYIEDFTTWKIVEPDELVGISTTNKIIPAGEIKAETIILKMEFDDIVRDIVVDALENGKPLRAS